VQLELFRQTEAELLRTLQVHLGEAVELTLTENRSSVLSFKPSNRRRPARVRMHRMFLLADADTLEAVGIWLRAPRAKRAATTVDAFIRRHEHLLAPPQGHRPPGSPRGKVHNLARLYRETNKSDFDGRVNAHIAWGLDRRGRPQRSIRLGSYCPRDRLIRIHPRLDHESVPEFFVRYIVFHEMLHADLGIADGENGRRRIHTPEFKLRERAYPDYARAIAWQDEPRNLAYLLGRRARPA
jgi:hypothetical protein